jgi:hypothetical protein
MLYREIIPVCSEIHTKHINTLCGLNAQYLIAELERTIGNHMTLKGCNYIFVCGFPHTSS